MIGNNDKDSFDIIKSLLATFVKGEIIDVDHKSAELIKIIENMPIMTELCIPVLLPIMILPVETQVAQL